MNSTNSNWLRNDVKRFVKRHPLLLRIVQGTYRFISHGLRGISMFSRFFVIRNYLKTHSCRKLQIGAGTNILPGWLNTELCLSSFDAVFLDATKHFPFDDREFDYVFSEHLIEHLTLDEGCSMLRECFRVLKPGGRVRMATPSLEVLIKLFAADATDEQNAYVKWFSDRNLPGIQRYRPVFVLNHMFYSWGHRFIYDRQTLEECFRKVGFDDLMWCHSGQSKDDNLRALERHGSIVGSEQWNSFETMILEARRPDALVC